MKDTENMRNNIVPVSSSVSKPNTPESDLMPTVEHVVSGYFRENAEEWAVLIDAADPVDALDKVKSLSLEEFQSLERVEDASTVKNRAPRP